MKVRAAMDKGRGQMRDEPFALHDVPKLTVSKQLRRPAKYDPSKEYRFRYKAKSTPNCLMW